MDNHNTSTDTQDLADKIVARLLANNIITDRKQYHMAHAIIRHELSKATPSLPE